MSNYNGTKCISCGEYFQDGDDVVVCPECGTPYHRECYLKEGECINTALHESGESWKPEYENQNNGGAEAKSGEPIRCIRCGAENPLEGLFCAQCGMPLSGGNEGRPFNSFQGKQNGNSGFMALGGFSSEGINNAMVFDRDSDLDGVKLDDYAKYVGRNPLSFLASFIRFAKTGAKGSLNLVALIFPDLYFFFRKMPKIGALVMLVLTLMSIPGVIYMGQSGAYGITLLNTNFDLEGSAFTMISNVCSIMSLAVKILCGIFGNYLYYRQARKDILNIHQNYDGKASEQEVKLMIAQKGGTSWAALIIGFTVSFVLSAVVLAGINFLCT